MVDNHNVTCSICLEDVEDLRSVIITECSHIFCTSCSAQWFYKSDKCPNCNHVNTNIYKLNKRRKIKKIINLKSRDFSEYIFKKKIIKQESTFNAFSIIFVSFGRCNLFI